MGRKGPCFHCGIGHTPLWRNGPPEKPVLCNACGSRWRIWGNLDNYIPKHANASMVNRNMYTRRSQQAGVGNDTNDGSQSASEISPSAICIQLENRNEREASGLVQPSFWNSHIPRIKRSVLTQRTLSTVERLQRQLYFIQQESQFSNLSSEQDDVLIHQKSQISSGEIGLGCVLLKSTAYSREEDKDKVLQDIPIISSDF